MVIEKPLLYTPDNLQKVLAGQKWETRRIVKAPKGYTDWLAIYRGGRIQWANDAHLKWTESPYGNPFDGEIWYWLKEPTIVVEVGLDRTFVEYSDGSRRLVEVTANDAVKLANRKDWRKPVSSMFMLKSFARHWVKAELVEVEKLHDITEEGAIAEGIQEYKYTASELSPFCKMPDERSVEIVARAFGSRKLSLSCMERNPVEAYRRLWDSINAKRGYPWDSNPLVYVIRHSKQIYSAPSEEAAIRQEVLV